MNKLIKQILKFVVVGGTAFVIDYAVFAFLTFISIHYLIAQLISFSVALVFNYVASIKWVFDAKKQTKKDIIIFIVLAVIGLGINEVLLYIGVETLHWHELLAKFVSSVIVMIYNFITRKLIVEKR